MKLQRYRIKTPTMAVSADGAQSTATVPVDAIVAICEELPARNRLIDVLWNDKRYSMFVRDLRERCEPVD